MSNWYTTQENKGGDQRVTEIIKKLQDFGVPEIPGVSRGEPDWTHETTATIGVKEYEERGEDAAEQYFLDTLAKAGMGDTDVMEDMNWGEPGTSEYNMMRSIVRTLTEIRADGSEIFGPTDEEDYEAIEEKERQDKEQKRQDYIKKLRSYL